MLVYPALQKCNLLGELILVNKGVVHDNGWMEEVTQMSYCVERMDQLHKD